MTLMLRDSVIPPPQRTATYALIAACALLLLLVLVVTCTNVAGLLLARSVGRRHEISVRLTLGASVRRLIAQLLTESILLGLLGGVAGAITAWWVLDAATSDPALGALTAHPDWRAGLVVVGVSLFSAMLFGLAPALQAVRAFTGDGRAVRKTRKSGRNWSRMQIFVRRALRRRFHVRPAARPRTSTYLHAGISSTHTPGEASNRLHGAVIAAQVTISFVLLVIASSAFLGVRAHSRNDPGFQVTGLIVVEPRLDAFGNDTVRANAYMADLEDRLAAVRGVRSTGSARHVPFSQSSSEERLTLLDGRSVVVAINAVGGGYFETIGITLLRGRYLRESDIMDAPRVAVVNQAFSELLGPAPVGRYITRDVRNQIQIIGVVEDVQSFGSGDADFPRMYVPAAQEPPLAERCFGSACDGPFYPVAPDFLVRIGSGTTAAEVGADVLRRLEIGYPYVAPPRVRTLSEMAEARAEPQRFASRAAFASGAIQLLLASIGFYGILALALLARTREIGIRLALGASTGQACWAITHDGLRSTSVGLICGAFLGVPAAMICEHAMLGTTAVDPLPFVIAVIAIVLATAVSAAVPLTRAARVQPIVALRHE